jgi:predicted exporter
VLHLALIVAGAYLCAAVLAYLVVLPILRAGKAADDAMAAEEKLARRPRRFRRSRFYQRARKPLGTSRRSG